MTRTLRNCTLAAAFVGSIVLLAAPASANSLHNEGNFGGTYSRIAPSSSYGYRRHAGRIAPLNRGYYGRGYFGRGYYGRGFG